MGYKQQAKTFRLVFDDAEFKGLEVRVRSMTIGKMREFFRVQRLREQGDDNEGAQATEQMVDIFESVLLSWNLEDEDGTPIPATREGIATQDIDFVMTVIAVWMEQITGVPDETPLPGPSSDGARHLEASMPMEPLSASRAS